MGTGAGLWDTNWGNHFQHAATNAVAAPIGGSLLDSLGMHGPNREGFSQSVGGFSMGQSYRVSFNQANGFFDPLQVSEDGGWEVYIGDTSVFQGTSTNSTTGATFPFNPDWNISEFEFAATAENQVFSFLPFISEPPLGQAASFQWIDNGQIVQTIPEPGLSSLLATLCLPLLIWRRRQMLPG